MGFPCYEESAKSTEEDILARKMKDISDCSGIDQIIIDNFDEYFPDEEKKKRLEPYVVNLIESAISDFRLDYGFGEHFEIVKRPDSLFQFKTITKRKDWLYSGGISGRPTTFETYYSVVDSDSIPRLTRECRDIEREGGVNPLEKSYYHASKIYVFAHSCFSGNHELRKLLETKRGGGFDNMTLCLVLDKMSVKERIRNSIAYGKREERRIELAKKLVDEGYGWEGCGPNVRVDLLSEEQLKREISQLREAKEVLSWSGFEIVKKD